MSAPPSWPRWCWAWSTPSSVPCWCLTLPVTLVSLGLFILVINALLFWLVAHLVEGFHVAGFWSAFLAAILYSVISWALSTLLLNKDGNP
jgi:putative membrane protein